MKKQFSAVLFDLDGVILDSMPQHARAWQEILRSRGLEVPLDFIFRNEGALGREVLRKFFCEYQGKDLDPALLERVMAELETMLQEQARLYLERYAERVRPFPQAKAVLAAMAGAGLATALVTSSRRSVVEGCLDRDILDHFRAVVTADDVSRHKPHPDPYLSGARTLGLEPERCLVVENAPPGIASALAAGATCYAVTTTLEAEHLGQAHAVFPDLRELALHLGLDVP